MARFEEGNDLGQKFQSGKEAAEAGQRGGVASGATRRRKRAIREALKALMDADHTSKSGEVLNGYEIYATDLWNIANSTKTKEETRLKAKKLLAELLGEMTQQVDLTSGGTPFEVKVVQTTPELKDKVNEYLDGGGSDGQGV